MASNSLTSDQREGLLKSACTFVTINDQGALKTLYELFVLTQKVRKKVKAV